VRFAVREGRLVPGRAVPGRGAYTCASVGCFEQALALRGFQRALRRAVAVDPALVRLYEKHL
jgi:predicted RNA-binding protein YlxR (DUF448 family)